MFSTGKRTRNVLSIETKTEIINRLERGEKGSSLAKIYNVGKATISDIKLKKETILKFASKCEEGSRKRKTMKKPKDEQLEEAMYLWYVQRRRKGQFITGPLLCEKALQLNSKLRGSPDFKASNGWLKNFKSRHGIRGTELQGKSLPDLEGFCARETLSNLDFGNDFKREIADTGYKGLPLQQIEGSSNAEPLPSTSATPCDTVVTDEYMERDDITSIKYEEVSVSEDEDKEVVPGYHDYRSTGMTDLTDISADLEDTLPTMSNREVPESMAETATNPSEGLYVRHGKEEAHSSTNNDPDVNELFAKYLTAELRSLHPEDAALLRKKIHILVADFMIYEVGRRSNVQEPSVSGSEHRS